MNDREWYIEEVDIKTNNPLPININQNKIKFQTILFTNY